MYHRYEFFFQRLPRPFVRFLRDSYLALLDLRDRVTGKAGALTPPRSLHFIGGGDFESIGEVFLGHFIKVGGLKENETVLDIGCGTGRMAIPMMKYLSESGGYHGFDISKKAIAWCQRAIASRKPNFKFYYANIYNKEYNPRGKVSAAEYRFPCDDNSVDFAFATSVFTHMRRGEVERYLAELNRTLKPSGRAMVSFFILDEENRRLVKEGRAVYDFVHDLGDCLTVDPHTPERATAFTLDDLNAMVAKAGLKIEQPILYGSWSGRKSMLDAQDIVIVYRRS
ncbi:MAG: SAM-dependent methyltransferase [Chloroflexi bacterium]|nr:class I SAM-dependent methyltransferase [Chloroflexi bacterium CFX1]RIK53344.1 MAG: SAM-dependent methyltransferase [Chloroflexota bacterium]